MIDRMAKGLESAEIVSRADLMSGAAVFRGTRVPVKNLFDYLEAGQTLDEFLEDFPTVSRAQVKRVLRDAETAVVRA